MGCNRGSKDLGLKGFGRRVEALRGSALKGSGSQGFGGLRDSDSALMYRFQCRI